jgi:hypothetical protein
MLVQIRLQWKWINETHPTRFQFEAHNMLLIGLASHLEADYFVHFLDPNFKK